MADWNGFHKAAETVLETGRNRSPSGFASVLSNVVKKLQQDEALKQDLNQKKNLLGYEGLIKGTVAPAKHDDTETVDVPGIGKVVPKNDLPVYKTAADGSIVQVGTMKKGGKLQGGGYGSAAINFANEMSPDIADALENGDVAPYLNSDSKTRTMVSNILAKKGIKIDDSVLGYKANQSAMTDIKVQDQKVNQANSLMTVFNKNYDPKTDTYNIPPSLHYELALGFAKMLSPQGVVAQQTADELRARTAKEGLAGAAIYLGVDPKLATGPTQSLIKYFRDNIDAQANMASQARDSYQQGQVNQYIGNQTSNGYKPIKSSDQTTGQKDYSSLWQ